MVAGPCSVESEAQILGTAQELAKCGVTLLRGGIWKPRTSPGSFEGVGEKGLGWLKAAGDATGLPVATEVATPSHVEHCLAAGIDVLWVGARTTTSPIAVQEIADALAGVDIPVMIKNPMSPELKLWIGAIDRVRRAGVTKTVGIHRGFSTHIRHPYRYRPLWNIPLDLKNRMPDVPVFCDPSHIAGERRFVSEVSMKAMELGFDGLMVECHWNPDTAKSDRGQQLSPSLFSALAEAAYQIFSQRISQDSRMSLRQREEIGEIDHDILTLLNRRMDLLQQERKMRNGVSMKDRIVMRTAYLLAKQLRRLASATPELRVNTSESTCIQGGMETPSRLLPSN